jgi:hypothetical protein
VSKNVPHISVTINVIASRLYLITVCGLLKPNLLNLFFILPPVLLNTSCKIPRGHRKEQYVRPVRSVRIRTIIKPIPAANPTLISLKPDGMN